MLNHRSRYKQSKYRLLKLIICSAVLLFSSTNAADFTVPNVFVAHQPAVADEVNENFHEVETVIVENISRLEVLENMMSSMQTTITSQQNTINNLQSRLSAVENNTVLELDDFLRLTIVDGHDTAEFSAVNVQINNGTSLTAGPVNGKGNLMIGYHEPDINAKLFCSDPQYTDELSCLSNNNPNLWESNVRTGSHNLILGTGHSFTSYSAFIAGTNNVSNGTKASVLGGAFNIAAGPGSVILGGISNTTQGIISIISGGDSNNTFGFYSSISGGHGNNAIGPYSSISGGKDRSTADDYDWVAGSLFENQ